MQNFHDVRDRTAEFFATVASLQKQHVATNGNTAHNHSSSSSSSSSHSASLSASSSSPPGSRLFTNSILPRSSSSTFPSQSSLHAVEESKDSTPLLPSFAASSPVPESEFNLSARRIGQSLSSLSEKLERLSRLVGKKSLFDDPSRSIEELTHLVKADLEEIDADINALDGLQRREGGRGGKEEESKHMASHSKVVVENLRGSLKKRTGEFMDLLQTRTRVAQQPTHSTARSPQPTQAVLTASACCPPPAVYRT
jgi:hypothetical protein